MEIDSTTSNNVRTNSSDEVEGIRMMRTLFVACLGLVVGVPPASAKAQDPLFIPSGAWDGLIVIGDPGLTKREFKFTLRGRGLNDFTNAALVSQIQNALTAAIRSPLVPWQAPALVGFPYQIGVPETLNPFLDIYYDTREGVNYLCDAAYRFRMRYPNIASIPNLQPLGVEYQSQFDQTPIVGGFGSRTECRLPVGIGPSVATLDAFIRFAQSGIFNSSAVMRPSSELVDFFRRKSQPLPLSYAPDLVFECERGQTILLMDLRNLQIGVNVVTVFLVSMETSRVYPAADYIRWLKGQAAVKPAPWTVLSEVEVEFERSVSVLLDQVIAQARSAGNTARVNQLTAVLNAFLGDQRTVMDIIRTRFAQISQGAGDANYLVCEPGVKSKYRRAFEAVFFIRGDVNFSGVVDISDPIKLLSMLFLEPSAQFTKACDANDDNRVDISDPVYLLTFLFLDPTKPPPSPYPYWGVDPTP